MPTTTADTIDPRLLKEFETIRTLLMLLALKLGASTNELGAALGVTSRRIRQMIPAGRIAKLNIEKLPRKGNA